MVTLILLGGTVVAWLLVLAVRRSGTSEPLLTLVACALLVGSTVWVVSWANSYSPVDVVAAVFHGYGVPGTHWFGKVPRGFIDLGALIALGVVVWVRDTARKLTRPGGAE